MKVKTLARHSLCVMESEMISEERCARANTGNHKFTDQPPSSNRDARARQAPGTHDDAQHGVSPGAHAHTPTRPHAQHTRSSGCGGEDSLHSNTYSSCGLSGIRHGAHSEAAAAGALIPSHDKPRDAAAVHRTTLRRSEAQMLETATWTSVSSNCSRSPGCTRYSLPPSLVGMLTPFSP